MRVPSPGTAPGTNDVDLPEGTITYRAAGPEDSAFPPVVFVHGLLVDNTLWTDVASWLAERGIRSYAPIWPLGSHRVPMNADADLSPRGMARVINGFLGALDLEDATLVGSDTGGALCQFTIDTDHSRIGRVVLTNCDAFELFPPPGFAPVIRLGQHPHLLKMLMATLLATPIRQSRLGYGLVFTSTPDARTTRRWIEPALRDADIRRDAAKVMRGIRPRDTLDLSTRFGDFTKPVHVVWGDDDAFFPIEVAERLAASFPSSTLTTIRGARTFISMDHPDRVGQVIATASGLAD
jgi:pimeloyl-ACP methyl ester carboxylesterase